MSKVDNLKWAVSVGDWRGHELFFSPKTGKFYSNSAGITDCATLSEITRAIDKMEAVKYRPIQAILMDTQRAPGAKCGDVVTVTRPAPQARHAPREFWIKTESGRRMLVSESALVPVSVYNVERAKEVFMLQAQAAKLEKRAREIRESLPRVQKLEVVEP